MNRVLKKTSAMQQDVPQLGRVAVEVVYEAIVSTSGGRMKSIEGISKRLVSHYQTEIIRKMDEQSLTLLEAVQKMTWSLQLYKSI